MDSEKPPNNIQWHALTIEDVLEELKTNEFGLNDLEASTRLEKTGLNLLTPNHKKSISRRYINYINRSLIIILLSLVLLSSMIE